MRDWWVRFGCFLTGYNYNIVHASSEVTAKAVKRYTAALLIVCILWSFIGFSFSQRYLKTGIWGSIGGAIILMVIIVQVERQIILNVYKNVGLYIFRGVIAVMMALIGSIIIDQIIFKEDIEQQKIVLLDEKVKKVLPAKTEEIRRQIKELDSTITSKEKDLAILYIDVKNQPTTRIVSIKNTPTPETSTTTDTLGRTTSRTVYKNKTSSSTSEIPNPKWQTIDQVSKQIDGLRIQKAAKDDKLLTLRPEVEAEIRSKVGFLDELKLMQSLISESGVALTVWLIWLCFLLGLELFILFSKLSEKSNDYEETVKHQMDLQIKRLRVMAKKAEVEEVL